MKPRLYQNGVSSASPGAANPQSEARYTRKIAEQELVVDVVAERRAIPAGTPLTAAILAVAVAAVSAPVLARYVTVIVKRST